MSPAAAADSYTERLLSLANLQIIKAWGRIVCFINENTAYLFWGGHCWDEKNTQYHQTVINLKTKVPEPIVFLEYCLYGPEKKPCAKSVVVNKDTRILITVIYPTQWETTEVVSWRKPEVFIINAMRSLMMMIMWLWHILDVTSPPLNSLRRCIAKLLGLGNTYYDCLNDKTVSNYMRKCFAAN